MKNKPLVSIITVCFNSEKFIEETIKSVINQTYKNIEYIIIDGGSTDKTLNIVDKYKDKIKYFVSEKDYGMYNAINKGLKVANGDILSYINSDDVYEDINVVEKIVREFVKDDSLGWIYSNTKIIDEKSHFKEIQRTPRYRWKLFACSEWSYITQPTTFWKKEVIETCGLFNEKYKMAADYEFFLKIGKKYKSKKMKFIVARFRLHNTSLTNMQKMLNNEEMNRIKHENMLIDIKLYKIYRMCILINFRIINIPSYVRRIISG